MMGAARQRQIVMAGIWALAAAAAGGLLIGISPRLLPPAATGVLAVVTLAGVFLAIRPRWRRLDDLERHSRLSSWYWGGGFGWALGLVLAAVLAGVRSPIFAGAALVSLLQFTGYAAARLQWWLEHRAPAA